MGRMSRRGEPMRCPSCGTRLVEVERSEVMIDACPECRGVWLDRGELDRVLDRERRAAGGVRDADQDFLEEMERPRGRPAERRPERRDHDDRREHRGRRRRSGLLDLLDFD
jgi:Zn-finger nucleic acid-binding protein